MTNYLLCPQCGWSDQRPVAQSWTIRGEGTIISGNALKANNSANYRYRKERGKFDEALKEQLNKIPRANKFRAAIITRYYGKGWSFRAYDFENFAWGCKPLVDVLKGYGVIADDSPYWFRAYYHQQKADGPDSYYTIELLEFAD